MSCLMGCLQPGEEQFSVRKDFDIIFVFMQKFILVLGTEQEVVSRFPAFLKKTSEEKGMLDVGFIYRTMTMRAI